MAKVLVISDLHYERMVYRSVDESEAFEWLLGVVAAHQPGVVLSTGDWGRALTPDDVRILTSMARVLTIHGNHENMRTLLSAHILMEPGRVYEAGGLRVAGISGIVSSRPEREGTPRRRPEDFIREAEALAKRGPIDVLLLHQPPLLPSLFPGIEENPGTIAALRALELISPRLAVVGHMHAGYRRVEHGETIVVHIDSSLLRREYIIIEDGAATVYRGWRIVDRFNL